MDKIKKGMDRFFYRLWINKSAILKQACTYTGLSFTVWGFISLFVSLTDYVPKDISFFYRVILGCVLVVCIFILSIFVAACRVLCTGSICVGESTSKNGVYVKYGDMFSPDSVEKGYNGKRFLVVSVNRCFDTTIDDHLVSLKTQHGKAFQELYDNRVYTPSSLNDVITHALSNNASYQTLSTKDKPEGNLRRYETGTTVTIRVNSELSYFLLGLSYFDEHLNAQTSKADFSIAVQRLIEYCNQNAQGYPVILPLLGSGMARTNIELTNILNYLVQAFAINKNIINNDFHIVVWKGDKHRVSISDLRKWL